MSQEPAGAICSCPNCGTEIETTAVLAEESQKQIKDLEAQVRLLNSKAIAAGKRLSFSSNTQLTNSVDKWADYEDEIQHLRAQLQRNSTDSERASSPIQSAQPPANQSRLSSFLSARKSTINLKALPPIPPTPSASDLAAALTREQALRQAAEGKLDEASGELEELSAQLFMQANEMVATERKARAKLEERVAVLETRDGEKRKRLERLEGAVQRIERVRGLLAPPR